MGGATVAAGLAGSGARILILEKGERLTRSTRDPRRRGPSSAAASIAPEEIWFSPDGQGFNPGNYYYVGGNTKFYGAVMLRYRKEDFAEMEFPGGGLSPAWPIGYEELEPWYGKAERLYQVRGAARRGPDRARTFDRIRVSARPRRTGDRPRTRAAEARRRCRPFSLPLGVDIDAWLSRRQDAMGRLPRHVHRQDGCRDLRARRGIGRSRHRHRNRRGGRCWLETDAANRIASVVYRKNGERVKVAPRTVILSAGAVHSAALLLQSANGANPGGLANRSDQVGRNFMNHNSSAMLAIDPRERNDFDLPEDPRHQRFLSRRRPRQRAARQYPAARARLGPDPERQREMGAGMGAAAP